MDRRSSSNSLEKKLKVSFNASLVNKVFLGIYLQRNEEILAWIDLSMDNTIYLLL